MEIDGDVGIFTIFKKEKQSCVCLQIELQGNPTLI